MRVQSRSQLLRYSFAAFHLHHCAQMRNQSGAQQDTLLHRTSKQKYTRTEALRATANTVTKFTSAYQILQLMCINGAVLDLK